MEIHELLNKSYLGDAVYIGHDDWHVWLYTSDGVSITNRIALDPHVLAECLKWVHRHILKDKE